MKKMADGRVEQVKMDKASVYPDLAGARALQELAAKQGWTDFHLMQLTLTETEIF
ncbi:MAG: hypothetical protein MJ157_01710 [Clostridia bacterium]|nr:hypothetical protein [Clostridia bacterium]